MPLPTLLVIILGLLVFWVGFRLSAWLQGSRNRSGSLRGDRPMPHSSPASHLSPQAFAAEIQALLQQGQTIAATKLVREGTGWSLKQSKEYVERLQRGEPLNTAELRAAAPRQTQPSRHISANLEAEVQALLAQDQLIAAVKLVRAHTGWSLQQSKAYVDRLAP